MADLRHPGESAGEAHDQQRAAGMATMANAFKALYAVLTPEQKAIADQNVAVMGHRGMRHGYGARAG